MNVEELVMQAKATAGKILADVPDGKAKALVRLVLAEIAKSVGAASEEPVRVSGLGVFRAKTVEREKDGVKTSVKRILFKPTASADNFRNS